MSPRLVIRDECTITVEAFEEPTSLTTARKWQEPCVIDGIVETLRESPLWGWCYVKVTASWGYTNQFDAESFITGEAYLGECSYKDEQDFRQAGDYFDQLVAEALDELNNEIQHLLANAACIEKVLSE